MSKEEIEKLAKEADNKKRNNTRTGMYSNYINTTNLDLSRYQIGNTIKEHRELSKT